MKLLGWLILNFGALIVFYGVSHFFGFKPAIVSSILFAVIEIAVLKLQKRSISPFVIFSFIIVLAFGAVDLYLKNSVLFKFEGAITNLIAAGFFGFSLFREKSIIEEFAEQQGRISSENYPDKTFFFEFMTSVWVFYFLAKAVAFAWLAMNTNLEDALIIRLVIGSVSFYILLGISIGLSGKIWNLLLKLKLMPSTR